MGQGSYCLLLQGKKKKTFFVGIKKKKKKPTTQKPLVPLEQSLANTLTCFSSAWSSAQINLSGHYTFPRPHLGSGSSIGLIMNDLLFLPHPHPVHPSTHFLPEPFLACSEHSKLPCPDRAHPGVLDSPPGITRHTYFLSSLSGGPQEVISLQGDYQDVQTVIYIY